MEEGNNPDPVRYRATLEWTFADADPWDARGDRSLLDAVEKALESAPGVRCRDVVIREAMRIGSNDDYAAQRNQPEFDWFFLSPDCGHIFGASYPVARVDPDELEQVWELTSKAERGELKNTNILIAIGRALKPESDGSATVTRAYILSALQKARAVPERPSRAIFVKAATIPIERPFQNESDFVSLANQLRD